MLQRLDKTRFTPNASLSSAYRGTRRNCRVQSPRTAKNQKVSSQTHVFNIGLHNTPLDMDKQLELLLNNNLRCKCISTNKFITALQNKRNHVLDQDKTDFCHSLHCVCESYPGLVDRATVASHDQTSRSDTQYLKPQGCVWGHWIWKIFLWDIFQRCISGAMWAPTQ